LDQGDGGLREAAKGTRSSGWVALKEANPCVSQDCVIKCAFFECDELGLIGSGVGALVVDFVQLGVAEKRAVGDQSHVDGSMASLGEGGAKAPGLPESFSNTVFAVYREEGVLSRRGYFDP